MSKNLHKNVPKVNKKRKKEVKCNTFLEKKLNFPYVIHFYNENKGVLLKGMK